MELEDLTPEDWKFILSTMAVTVRKEHFDKGLPIVYRDKDRWIVEEWPDGRIVKLKAV